MHARIAMKVLGYVRCSTEEQVVDGVSLAAQRGRIEAWCQATDAELVQVVEDGGISGTRPLAERPGGAQVASLLERRNPDIEVVVIVRLDRLARNAADALHWLHKFAKGSVGLVSIDDRLDLGTPQGRAMAGMAAIFGSLERELVAQRTADALAELRSQGKVFGPIPFGFRRDGDHLVLHEGEQRVLGRIKRLRNKGKSYAAIANALNRASIPSKRGGCWHAMSVRSVLRTASTLDGKVIA
jgi:site-specific DNA recombinase